jgi:NAD(P)-dependent dehydrogenase (short-subunit alcohol dehydrogenase family)
MTKVVLVTGGNRGIGHEICRQLLRSGCTVIMGSRDLEKGEAVAAELDGHVIVRQLDVTDEAGIQKLKAYITAEFGKLDVLINNAGIGEKPQGGSDGLVSNLKNTIRTKFSGTYSIIKGIAPVLRKTGIMAKEAGAKDTSLMHVKQIMETNFYGAWRMIQVLVPLLEMSGHGRIINISSGMGELKSLTGYYPGYSLSKASLNALTIMLSNELKESGIRVNAVCPGWVRTDMGGPSAPRNVSEGADTTVWLATKDDIPTGKFFKDRMEIEW